MAVSRYRGKVKARDTTLFNRADRVNRAGAVESGQAKALQDAMNTFVTTKRVLDREDAISKQADRDRAQLAFNEFSRAIAKPRAEYLNTKLHGAADAYGKYEEMINVAANDVDKSLANKQQREMFRKKVDGMSVTLTSEAEKHIAKESRRSQDVIRAEAETGAVRDAMINIFDDTFDQRARNALFESAANQAYMESGGQFFGVTTDSKEFNDTVNQLAAAKVSDFTATKILRMADLDGTRAMGYFEENKKFLTAQDTQKISSRLQRRYREDFNDKTGASLAASYGTTGSGAEQAYNAINKMDPKVRLGVARSYENQKRINDRLIKARQVEAWQGLYQQFEGRDMTDPANIAQVDQYIDSSMPPQTDTYFERSEKDKMRRVLKNKALGNDTFSDFETLRRYQDMLREDPAEFARADIDTSGLSPRDARSLFKMQSTIMKGNSKQIQRIRRGSGIYEGVVKKALIDATGIQPKDPGFKDMVKYMRTQLADNFNDFVAGDENDSVFLNENTPKANKANRDMLYDLAYDAAFELKDTFNVGDDKVWVSTEEDSAGEPLPLSQQPETYQRSIEDMKSRAKNLPGIGTIKKNAQERRDLGRGFLESLSGEGSTTRENLVEE